MRAALSHKLHELIPFPFGTVAKWPEITQPSAYSEIAIGQFNSFTPEHVLKAASLQPSRDKFNWANPDAFIAFCLANQKKVHAHTLLWDMDLPTWIPSIEKEDKDILQTHVWQVVNRYKGKIRGWDVVNEAFDESGNVRRGVWHRVAGTQYIEHAFRTAHEADNETLLFYNDFDLEANRQKRHGVLNYLNSLRASGVTVHGVGLQMHLNISSANVSQIEEAFREVAEAGYMIHVSELDLSINPYNGIIKGKEELYQAQARLVWLVVEKFMEVPEELRYGITFWGVGDADSWLTRELNKIDYPLLFDEDYLPKPAWYTLVHMFTQKS